MSKRNGTTTIISSGMFSDMSMALDPTILAEVAGFTQLDGWQRRLLYSDAPRILLNCSRQSGKSSMAALLAIYTALYGKPGSLTLVIAAAQRQSAELLKKILRIYHATGRMVPATAESATSLELSNGSRVVSLPSTEHTIRSFSAVDLLIVDEASRVHDEVYASVRPMLAVSGGRLVTLSTPFGTRGWWYEAYRNRLAEHWDYYEVAGTSCPRISAEFLAEEQRALGSFWYQQEYENAFLDAQTAAFRSLDVEARFKEYQQWDLDQYRR